MKDAAQALLGTPQLAYSRLLRERQNVGGMKGRVGGATVGCHRQREVRHLVLLEDEGSSLSLLELWRLRPGDVPRAWEADHHVLRARGPLERRLDVDDR